MVTILSPCYNVEQFLPKYFETVLGQTYTNLQVVLIDDGSTDDTWKVMYEYASNDSRVEIYHQSNQGVATTRNNLLEKAKGDFVLFVDSDDWIELDMVEFLVNVAIKYSSKFVMCDRVINDSEPNTPVININTLSQEQAVCDFLRHEYFVGSLWNKLFHRSLLQDVRFNDNISYGEDALFCWHVLQNTDNVVVTNKQLYHYRMNDNSLSHSSWTPEKKGSNHVIWDTITEETKLLWPQYYNIAKAKYVIEDMWALIFAALSDYPFDEQIEIRQKNVRDNLSLINNSGLINWKKTVAAYALAYCYKSGKILKHLI